MHNVILSMADMTTQRERFEHFFALPGARHLEAEAAILAAADAYDAAKSRGRMDASEVEIIVDAVSSDSRRISESCYTLLAFASQHWNNAADAIVGMSHNPRAHVRFNAICSLSRKTPQGVIDKVLRGGLTDRSSRVRWKAADRAETLDQSHLVPDIAAALSAEKNEKARKEIGFALGFLRDGYDIRRRSSDSFTVSVRLGRGSGGTLVDVTAEELDAKGIQAIVAEVQKQYEENG